MSMKEFVIKGRGKVADMAEEHACEVEGGLTTLGWGTCTWILIGPRMGLATARGSVDTLLANTPVFIPDIA